MAIAYWFKQTHRDRYYTDIHLGYSMMIDTVMSYYFTNENSRHYVLDNLLC